MIKWNVTCSPTPWTKQLYRRQSKTSMLLLTSLVMLLPLMSLLPLLLLLTVLRQILFLLLAPSLLLLLLLYICWHPWSLCCCRRLYTAVVVPCDTGVSYVSGSLLLLTALLLLVSLVRFMGFHHFLLPCGWSPLMFQLSLFCCCRPSCCCSSFCYQRPGVPAVARVPALVSLMLWTSLLLFCC